MAFDLLGVGDFDVASLSIETNTAMNMSKEFSGASLILFERNESFSNDVAKRCWSQHKDESTRVDVMNFSTSLLINAISSGNH